MRHLIPFLFAVGCGHEYALHNRCVAFGHLSACPTEIDFSSAAQRCDSLGLGHLVTIEGLEEQAEVAAFGERELGVAWWGGHEGTSYACPVMDWGQTSTDSDCDALRPFVCELSGAELDEAS